MMSGDENATLRRVSYFGTDHTQHAIAQVGDDPLRLDRMRQLKRAAERAVPAFETMEVFARGAGVVPDAGNRQTAVMEINPQIVAREPGQFGGHDVGVGGLEEIDGWLPSALAGRKSVQALMDQQVANRVPAGKGHPRIVPQGIWSAEP